MAEAIWKTASRSTIPPSTLLGRKLSLDASSPTPVDALLRHAARWVARALRRRAGAPRADGLRRHADRGSTPSLEGANGERLAQRIREQFPVALIDEFQDTDPVQYRIFDAVYGIADNRTDIALVLIGDPKQAIYGFRGADIYTYLAARGATAPSRQHTLARNFRSTPAMVEAVNRCFGAAEQREGGEGAFLFRSAEGNRMPFVEAVAEGRKERFFVGKEKRPRAHRLVAAGHRHRVADRQGRLPRGHGRRLRHRDGPAAQPRPRGKAGFTEDGAQRVAEVDARADAFGIARAKVAVDRIEGDVDIVGVDGGVTGHRDAAATLDELEVERAAHDRHREARR